MECTLVNICHIVSDGNGGQSAAASVFASRFISTTCTLNDRKVPTWIIEDSLKRIFNVFNFIIRD